MKISTKQVRKIIREELEDYFDNVKPVLGGSAREVVEEYPGDSVYTRLTNGPHQVGYAKLSEPLSVNEERFVITSIVRMSNPRGASDADGPGADGIKFTIEGETGNEIAVDLDSYYNFENKSGNEIDLEINGQIVESAYVPERLNDNKTWLVNIINHDGILDIKLENVSEGVDEGTVTRLTYPISFHEFLGSSCEITVMGVCGDGWNNHDLISLQVSSPRDKVLKGIMDKMRELR